MDYFQVDCVFKYVAIVSFSNEIRKCSRLSSGLVSSLKALDLRMKEFGLLRNKTRVRLVVGRCDSFVVWILEPEEKTNQKESSSAKIRSKKMTIEGSMMVRDFPPSKLP